MKIQDIRAGFTTTVTGIRRQRVAKTTKKAVKCDEGRGESRSALEMEKRPLCDDALKSRVGQCSSVGID